MPIPVKLEKRKVILNESCSKVLALFFDVLKENGLSMEKDSTVLSSVNTSTKTPVEGTLNKLKRVFEDVCGLKVGGHSQDLPESKAKMDDGGNALFTIYHEYWVKLMRGRGQFKAEQLTSETIQEPYVLIMELHLRLAMQALRLDSELKSDQERQLFIQILSSFSVKLSEKGLLNGVLQEDLFSGHKKWLMTLVDTANQIDKMNKATPVLAENLAYLQSLEKKIMRHLILVLTKYGAAFLKTEWPGKLADDQLTYTLEEAESKILSEKAQKLKQIENSMQDGTSVVAYSSNELSINCTQIDLVAYGILTEEEVFTQKKMIALSSEEKSEIRNLYALLNKNKIMRQFLGKLDSSVILLGWLPFLLGVVALDDFDDAIVQHVKLCEMTFKNVEPKREFYSTLLGAEFGQRSHNDIIRKTSLPKLSTLQNSELLKTVFLRIGLDLERLAALGAIVNCRVVCNPFGKKSTRDLSPQFHNSASQKRLGNQSATLSRSLNFFDSKGDRETVGSTSSRMISTNPNSSSSNPFVGISSTQSLTFSKLPGKGQGHGSLSAGVSPTSSHERTNSLDGLQGGRGRSTSTGSDKPSRKSSTNPFNNISSPLNEPVLLVNSDQSLDYPSNSGGIDREAFAKYRDREERLTGNNKKGSRDYTSTNQTVELERLPSAKKTSGKFSSNVYSAPKKVKKIKFTTAYIETFINTIGGLTEDEVSKAAKISSNQPKYFESAHVSDFCRRAREITRSFIPQLSHEKPFLGGNDILRYRRDEVAVLQYFCVEAAQLGDDSRLMNFINTMIEMTEESLFWTDYNNLKNHFRALLTSQRRGEVIAVCKLKNNSDYFQEKLTLLDENNTLRLEAEKLSKKIGTIEGENMQLKNENEGLRQQNFGVTKHLALELDSLKRQMQLQNKEIEEIKKRGQIVKSQSLEQAEQSANGNARCTLF